MKKSIPVCLFFLMTIPLYGNTLTAFFSDADNFLKKYVRNGNVAYDQINKNPGEIEKLYKAIGLINLSGTSDAQKQAYYINAYNLIVIYSVNKYFPVSSPMDINGFFDGMKHLVAGESLTLNTLEKNKLLRVYKDARFHFVLVCAAKSCPPLAAFAFFPEQLDKQLTERTTLALNNSDWLTIDSKKKVVSVSKIFEWYQSDFTTGGKKIPDWINQYRKEKIPSAFRVEYYEYNWSLNRL